MYNCLTLVLAIVAGNVFARWYMLRRASDGGDAGLILEPCPACDGSGICPTCNGAGCLDCGHTRDCLQCGGSGEYDAGTVV